MSYKVKGSTIKTKLAYVKEKFGSEAEIALIDKVGKERLHRLLDGSWYAFALYVEVLRTIADQHFSGDLRGLREVGRYSPRQALGSTYKAFVAAGSYASFLGRITSLHHMFYNTGRSTISLGEDGSSCRIVLSDKPNLAEEDLQIALGFYLGSGVLCGHDSVQGDFSIVGREAHFELSWS